MPQKLSQDQITSILSQTGKRKKQDPTEPREVTTWFRLGHRIREEGCDNPDCQDPRESTHGQVVAEVKGKFMCRYCFLPPVKWLSNG